MLLLYILWENWPIFMISVSNEQLQQQFEYTLLKQNFHSWWISKMQSGREDTLEERYAIRSVLNLEKMPQKWMEGFRLLLDQPAWIEHQFLEGRQRVCEWWEVWGVKKSIDQSWLAKGFGLGLLCSGFKGVQEEIPSEEASTLQIGSVAFPPDNAPVHNSIIVPDYLTQMGIRTVPHPTNSPELFPCEFWLFPKLRGCRYETIEETNEAVTKVIDTLTQEDFHGAFQKFMERYNKCIANGGEYFEGD